MLRFWSKVQVSGLDECWNWTASVKSNGYGQFGGRREGLSQYAHRTAYLLTHEEIPHGHEVCHSCDNRRCCNPAHLFIGTHQDNMMDMKAKERQAKPTDEHKFQASIRMKANNPMRNTLTVQKMLLTREPQVGMSNGRAKLTEDQVRKIYLDGRFEYVIAKDYGISQSSVNRIKTHQTWQHITEGTI